MEDIAPPPTVAAICDHLGRKAMSKRLGVGVTAISNAATEGRFPAKWFQVVRAMCVEAAIACPESLFNFTLLIPDQRDVA